MSYYTQLTQEERYHISVLCKERFPKAEIARRHSSAIHALLHENSDVIQVDEDTGLNKHIKRHYVDIIQQRKRQNLRIKPSDCINCNNRPWARTIELVIVRMIG